MNYQPRNTQNTRKGHDPDLVVRVALLDGDATQHNHLQAYLAAHEPAWQLDQYTHGESAWPALQASPPQLVLLERTLPDGCGLEWLRRCKRQMPAVPVVMLTTQNCAKTLWDALAAGAHGYCVKGGDDAGLVVQMGKALAGQMALCDQSERLLQEAFALMRQSGETVGLSRREHEIMVSLCQKHSDKAIAVALGISDETVHVHLHNAFNKLGVHDRKAAVMKFLKSFPGGKQK